MPENKVTVTFSGARGSGKTVLRHFIAHELAQCKVEVEHCPQGKFGDDDTIKVLVPLELKKRKFGVDEGDIAHCVRAFLIAEATKMNTDGRPAAAKRVTDALEDLSVGQLLRLGQAIRELE